jgi:hypothetical protein
MEQIKNVIKLHKHRYGIYNGELLDSISLILGDINANKTFRNMFAHFCLSRATDNEIFCVDLNGIIEYKNGKVDSKSKRISLNELNKIHTNAYDIVDRLENIIDKLPQITEKELITCVKNKI